MPDNCVAALLAFLHHFMVFLSTLTLCSALSSIAKGIPKNVGQLRTIAGINVDTFSLDLSFSC